MALPRLGDCVVAQQHQQQYQQHQHQQLQLHQQAQAQERVASNVMGGAAGEAAACRVVTRALVAELLARPDVRALRLLVLQHARVVELLLRRLGFPRPRTRIAGTGGGGEEEAVVAVAEAAGDEEEEEGEEEEEERARRLCWGALDAALTTDRQCLCCSGGVCHHLDDGGGGGRQPQQQLRLGGGGTGEGAFDQALRTVNFGLDLFEDCCAAQQRPREDGGGGGWGGRLLSPGRYMATRVGVLAAPDAPHAGRFRLRTNGFRSCVVDVLQVQLPSQQQERRHGRTIASDRATTVVRSVPAIETRNPRRVFAIRLGPGGAAAATRTLLGRLVHAEEVAEVPAHELPAHLRPRRSGGFAGGGAGDAGAAAADARPATSASDSAGLFRPTGRRVVLKTFTRGAYGAAVDPARPGLLREDPVKEICLARYVQHNTAATMATGGGGGSAGGGGGPVFSLPQLLDVLEEEEEGGGDGRSGGGCILGDGEGGVAGAAAADTKTFVKVELDGGRDLFYFCEGGSDRFAAAHRLPDAALAGIMAQLCAGIAALHARGFAHLDVALPNAVFDRRTGRAAIIDLGFARRLPRHVATGAVRPFAPGRLQPSRRMTSAPELYDGTVPVDARKVDTFALGSVCFCLATKTFPFSDAVRGVATADDPVWRAYFLRGAGKVGLHMCQQANLTFGDGRGTSLAVQDAVAWAMHPDPSQRCTVEQLGAAFERIAAGARHG